MPANSLKPWILASRPKTLPAAIVPVWAGGVLAWHLTGEFDLPLALLTVLGAIFIQIATNFFNDAIDARKGADTPERVGPQRAVASGLLSSRRIYQGALVMLGLASVCGLLLFEARGWPIILIGIPSLYLSYGYTGGPFPLAYRGVGELFVILFFGLVAVSGSVFIQIGTWPGEALILGLQIGFLSAVLIAVNNYRDVEEDVRVDKNTLAVVMGRPAMKILIILMTLMPALLILTYPRVSLGWFFTSLILAVLFVIAELKGLRQKEVTPSLLGVSALHLIIFVAIQNFVMALT